MIRLLDRAISALTPRRTFEQQAEQAIADQLRATPPPVIPPGALDRAVEQFEAEFPRPTSPAVVGMARWPERIDDVIAQETAAKRYYDGLGDE